MAAPHPTLSVTLKAIAHLLCYPAQDPVNRQTQWASLLPVFRQEAVLSTTRLQDIERLVASLIQAPPLQLEAQYVQTFDTRRNQSLHLFEHVHGDSRDRGPAMIDLTTTYHQSGLYLKEGELPDYLPVVLEFASTLEASKARAFLAEFAHLIALLYSALTQQGSRYACLFGALLELAGASLPVTADTGTSTRQPTQEPSIDYTWEEPIAFSGCSTQGQSSPATQHPIHIVARNHPPLAQGVQP